MVIPNVAHRDECIKKEIPFREFDDIKKESKNKQAIKKWARKYDRIFVSSDLNKKVIKTIGKLLSSVKKLPVQVPEAGVVSEKIESQMRTITFKTNKCSWLATSIAIETQEQEQVRQNIVKSLNFLIAQLPKGWLNIKTLHIKSTMMKGKAIRID